MRHIPSPTTPEGVLARATGLGTLLLRVRSEIAMLLSRARKTPRKIANGLLALPVLLWGVTGGQVCWCAGHSHGPDSEAIVEVAHDHGTHAHGPKAHEHGDDHHHRARAALRDAWAGVCGPCITVDAGTSCACSGSCDGESE